MPHNDGPGIRANFTFKEIRIINNVIIIFRKRQANLGGSRLGTRIELSEISKFKGIEYFGHARREACLPSCYARAGAESRGVF